jgi:hypothetical protein
VIADILFAAFWPPAWAFLWPRIARRTGLGADVKTGEAWVGGAAGAMIGCAGDWPAFTCAAVNLLIGVWLWQRNRRKRKRAPRFYGLKSRALVAAVVRRAREAGRFRPPLRPVLGGAR